MNDKVTFVSHTNKPGGGELALRRYLNATNLPVRLVTAQLGGVWQNLSCDVVHTPNPLALRRSLRGSNLVVANSMRAAFAISITAPLHTRLVYWVRDGLTHSAMSPLALALTRHITSRRMEHYIANSEWTAHTVMDALEIGTDKIAVIHSMCGVNANRNNHPPRTPPRADTPLRLLFLGRLAAWKAPDVAVRAIPLLRDLGIEATLTIAGDSLFDERAYFEQLASLVESEPRASLLGHIHDINELLESHDLLIHCSVAPEPFGQVIVQALAAGLPVLATNHGGPADILGPSPVSLVYPPYNSQALAYSIREVLGNYTQLSAWAIERSRLFSDEASISSTDTLLRALTSRYRR